MNTQIEQLSDIKRELNFCNKTLRISEVMERLGITERDYAVRIFQALRQQEKQNRAFDVRTWKVFKNDIATQLGR